MKKVLKILSGVCLLTAAVSIVMGVVALITPSRGFFAGYALFNMVGNGGFMGFMGNLLGIIFTAACFGAMGFYGIQCDRNHSAKKNALIWSIITAVLGIISMIVAIGAGMFTFGDLILAALPIAFGFIVIKEA